MYCDKFLLAKLTKKYTQRGKFYQFKNFSDYIVKSKPRDYVI